MGDPTGIGPEIIARSLGEIETFNQCMPLVFGRARVLARALRLIGSDQQVLRVDSMEAWEEEVNDLLGDSQAEVQASGRLPPKVFCLEVGDSSHDSLEDGKISAGGGQLAYEALVAATRLTLDKRLDGIVTAPLQKESLHLAGHKWPGHTEILADLCGVDKFAMMLYLPHNPQRRIVGEVGFGVIHVTLHMALKEVFDHITSQNILATIELAHDTFQSIRRRKGGPTSPALAVSSLNPHCGEGGLFGDEEERIIRPAVQQAKQRGWNVEGPLSVDTLMPIAIDGKYDAVVAMYHDQGHIALKLLDMYEAINITLGLPIVRTSVAHGTAHDISWRGIARHRGMTQAIFIAASLAAKQT
jgi:4-hydroxythreonine-4-phosphate dehydrogenase